MTKNTEHTILKVKLGGGGTNMLEQGHRSRSELRIDGPKHRNILEENLPSAAKDVRHGQMKMHPDYIGIIYP